MHTRLLKALQRRIRGGAWEAELLRLVRGHRCGHRRVFAGVADYHEMSVLHKALALYELVHFVLDDDEVLRAQVTKEVVRTEALGYDRGDGEYFYLGNQTRCCVIYRGSTSTPELEPITHTLEEMQAFAERMTASSDDDEQELGRAVLESVIPGVQALQTAHERKASRLRRLGIDPVLSETLSGDDQKAIMAALAEQFTNTRPARRAQRVSYNTDAYDRSIDDALAADGLFEPGSRRRGAGPAAAATLSLSRAERASRRAMDWQVPQEGEHEGAASELADSGAGDPMEMGAPVAGNE